LADGKFSQIDSRGADFLNIDSERENQLVMKGGGVFQFVLAKLERSLDEIRAMGISFDEIDWYVHQGSAAVVEAIQKELKMTGNSLFRAKDYGNIVGSSIPIQFLSDTLKEGKYCAFLAFGMGLRISMVVCKTGHYV